MRRLLPLLILLVSAGTASALPGDPPIELRSPAAGGTLTTDPAGLEVSYTCPLYRSADFGDGTGIVDGEAEYTVLLADSPKLDGEGRLADTVSRAVGASRPADPNLCFARVGDGRLPTGTYFWQVSRICSQCSPQFEVSEVRSFTLAPATKPTIGVPSRVYAGYPFIAAVRGELPARGTVTVERRAGSGWKAVGTGAVASGRSDATAVLPKGEQTLRARVGGVVSALRTVRVRSAKAKATTVRAGRWTGQSSAAFRVTGRTIRRFAVDVPLLCPTPGMVSPFGTQIATAVVQAIRLAPDGSFVGVSTAHGSVRVRGRLKGGRLTGGRVEMSLGVCTGSAALHAAPA